VASRFGLGEARRRSIPAVPTAVGMTEEQRGPGRNAMPPFGRERIGPPGRVARSFQPAAGMVADAAASPFGQHFVPAFSLRSNVARFFPFGPMRSRATLPYLFHSL
jgi:hypothetical protein